MRATRVHEQSYSTSAGSLSRFVIGDGRFRFIRPHHQDSCSNESAYNASRRRRLIPLSILYLRREVDPSVHSRLSLQIQMRGVYGQLPSGSVGSLSQYSDCEGGRSVCPTFYKQCNRRQMDHLSRPSIVDSSGAGRGRAPRAPPFSSSVSRPFTRLSTIPSVTLAKPRRVTTVQEKRE